MSKSAVQAVQPAVDPDRIKDQFTAMISHELRTPLCAAKEAVELLSEGIAGAVSAQQTPFLDVASRNIDRLGRIIDNVLDFGVLQRGQLAIVPEALTLGPFLESFVAEQSPVAAKAGLRLEFREETGAPLVSADRARLRQVLLNLLDNAIRYTSEGRITIELAAAQDDARITVVDTGCGLSEDVLEEIFEPFFQVSVGTGRRVGGCGIGLALCRGLVELHGGKIWAQSQLGHGTSLHILLPGADKASLGSRP